jgi:hypothetical protein
MGCLFYSRGVVVGGAKPPAALPSQELGFPPQQASTFALSSSSFFTGCLKHIFDSQFLGVTWNPCQISVVYSRNQKKNPKKLLF